MIIKGKGDPKIFLFGGLSCQFATLFTNPIDVVKTRMQLAGELSGAHGAPPSSSSKRGLLSVARLLAANEGPRAFYRGLTASILREALYSSTRMGLYEPFKELFAPGVQASDLSLHVRILAGGFAGAFGALVSNPTDLVRVRMQVS
jgi:solute carrier family 25 oxoglutarate transporter 11